MNPIAVTLLAWLAVNVCILLAAICVCVERVLADRHGLRREVERLIDAAQRHANQPRARPRA